MPVTCTISKKDVLQLREASCSVKHAHSVRQQHSFHAACRESSSGRRHTLHFLQSGFNMIRGNTTTWHHLAKEGEGADPEPRETPVARKDSKKDVLD